MKQKAGFAKELLAAPVPANLTSKGEHRLTSKEIKMQLHLFTKYTAREPQNEKGGLNDVKYQIKNFIAIVK